MSSSAILVVPDLTAASSDSRVEYLKERCDNAKPLGLARVDRDENMVIYDGTKHSVPNRIVSYFSAYIQILPATLIDTVFHDATPASSDGNAKQRGSQNVNRTFSSSVRSSSRCDKKQRAG